jgi:hypothetical protein
MTRPLAAAQPLPPSEGFIDSGCATILQFQREIQASRPTVEKLLQQGLPHFDIGTGKKRCVRIPRAAAMAWLRGRR